MLYVRLPVFRYISLPL